jgi:hypothetical protein
VSRSLQAEIEIRGTAEQVWAVLTDFAAYRDWNPFIVQGSGTALPGHRLELRMRLNGRTTTFRPQVQEADPGRKLRWLGRLVMPGLFDGEHSFTIRPTGPGQVRLTQHEEFRGLLAPVLLAMIAKPTLASFQQMNQAVKARVEQPTAARS